VEPQVEEVLPQINFYREGLHVIAHRAMLDVSRELAHFVARLLRAERRRRGTRKGSRALSCYRQAVLALRWFRHGGDKTALGRDVGISRSTTYRYIDEVIEVLTDLAPDLHEVLQRAQADGLAYVILDGKIFTTDRCGEQTTSVKGKSIDLWYSGKAHHHGGLIQAISTPDGFPLWVSDVEPGSTHDLTAARAHALPALYAAAARGLPTLADLGYESAGHGILTPFKQPTDGNVLHPDNRTYNALLRRLRCLGERAFAVLTGRWRTLRHTTASPSKIGPIVQAALVLTHFEYGRLT
jgi:hypothetical protein